MPIDRTRLSAPGRSRLILRIMRVHQWSKNFLVFVPIILAARFDFDSIAKVSLGFMSLCFTASSLYIVNDLIDVEHDRTHPLKRHRPIASGEVNYGFAMATATACAAAGLMLAMSFGTRGILAGLAYMTSSLSYQLLWKRLLLADVLALALLYSFRLFVGSIYGRVDISDWLIVFSVFFFLGLAVMKRIVDLAGGETAGVQAKTSYRPEDAAMLQVLGISASMSSFAVLAQYVYSERGKAIYAHHEFLWGVWLVVFYCVGRLWFSVTRGEVEDDPVTYVLRAPYCQISIVLTLILMLLARTT